MDKLNIWDELIQAERRLDPAATRQEMLNVSVAAYTGGAITGFLALLLSGWPAASFLTALAILAMVVVTTLFLHTSRRQVPIWVLVAQVPYAAILLSIAVWIDAHSSPGTLALFYVLISLYAFYFLKKWVASSFLLFAATLYASALIAKDVQDWLSQSILMLGSCITVSVVVTLLVKRVHRLATEDSLTGLANRRLWEALIRHEVASANRYKQTLSIALIDLDGFKGINDAHGHLHGDEILQQVSAALREVCRAGDTPARWGGDEFGLLLLKCDTRDARSIVNRLGDELGDIIRISAGIATWEPGKTADEMIREADRSLYESKSERIQIQAENSHTKAAPRLQAQD